MRKKILKPFSLPSRVTDIDDRVFWKSLRPLPQTPGAARLGEALKYARKADFGTAYAALAEYHRQALKNEWELIRAEHLKSPAPKPAILRDLLNHKINVWHTSCIQFGPRIDWWPPAVARDNIHGLHRLHFLAHPLRAFVRTRDKRCRDFLVDIIDQYWAARNHPRWPEIRLVAFRFLEIAAKWPILLATYLALLNEGGIPPRTISQLMRLFMIFGRSLSFPMGDFVPGYNAQAVGYMSLLHIARCFPEFRASPAWDRQAVRLVVEQARRGFFEDGGNRERVWGYGTMHVSSLSKPYEIAQRFGGLAGHEREIATTLRKACQWYVKTVAPPPNYAFPTYGDAGWGGHDKLALLRTLASSLPGFERDPLLGVDRTRGYLLKPSGFAIMRNGDKPDSAYVNLSFGKFAGWHSHWDLLSMNFWALGKPLLEELCRFGPYANPLDTLFREPQSHNLVLIDGMIYDSRLVEGQDVAWHSDDRIEYFSAWHRAYRYFVYGRDESNVSPNIEAKVRRTVLLVKDPGYVVVLDSVEDINAVNFNRSVSQYWHSPTPFRAVGPSAVRTSGRIACLLMQIRAEGVHRQDTGKDFGGAEIAHLGVGFERYSLRVRRWMPINHQGITGFVTLLYPFAGTQPRITTRLLPTKGGALFRTEALEIDAPSGKDIVILNPERRAGFAWNGRPMRMRALVELGRGRGDALVR